MVEQRGEEGGDRNVRRAALGPGVDAHEAHDVAHETRRHAARPRGTILLLLQRIASQRIASQRIAAHRRATTRARPR